MRAVKRFLTRVLILLVVVAVILGFIGVTISGHLMNSERDNITSTMTSTKTQLLSSEIDKLDALNADCILVLGAGIKDKQTPSPMLKDRLDTAVMLYKAGVAPKILLSGDNGTVAHNEIHVMLKYVKAAGIPDKDIFCDHAGFSTYDSMYRAKSIFQVKKAIIVTQTYHMYRALYIAEKLDINVLGVASDQKKYRGQVKRELREILARDKDFFKVMVKPKSAVGGSTIPITGNGTVSHGE
jgi:Uncharacterized membrane protein